MGKTALVVHAAHRLASRFPDGQLFATLRGGAGDEPADPAEVLGQWLRLLGVDGSALPAGVDARASLFRARLAGLRVLVVVDDAAGHHQVEPLLPAGGAAALVTSRLQLTGLSGVTAVDLRPLPGPSAVELLCQVAGEQRVRAEPAAADRLVAACGALPLAVRIAAARLAARPHWTVEALAGRLADERSRLDELCHGDLSVRPGLQLTYQGLTDAARRAFALLGGLGVASFPEWPVAALLDVDPAAGGAVLEELLDARLLDCLGPDAAGQPRYRFHEVTQVYARERRLADVDQHRWRAALSRAAAGWLACARQAQGRLRCERFHLDDRNAVAAVPDPPPAGVAARAPLDWFEAEKEALVTLVAGCAEAGLAATARCLAGCGADFFELRGYYRDWHRAIQSALAACRRAGDRAGEAAMLRGLGSCLVELEGPEPAIATLRAARALAEEVGDSAGAAMARKDLGYELGLAGKLPEAEAELRAAVNELERAGRPATRAMALTSLGFVVRQRGDVDAAIRIVGSALTLARSCGDRFMQAYASRGLAGALLAGGRLREAQRVARRAAAVFQQIGDPIGSAQSLRVLGEALAREPHRRADAERALAAAAAVFRERGYEWGVALTELSLGEIEVGCGGAGGVDLLRRSLRYWTDEQVPALQARALVALATAAERAGDPAAHQLLARAHQLYCELDAPEAAGLAVRLARPGATARPVPEQASGGSP